MVDGVSETSSPTSSLSYPNIMEMLFARGVQIKDSNPQGI